MIHATREEWEKCECCKEAKLFAYLAIELAERNHNRLKIQIMRPENSSIEYGIRGLVENGLKYVELRLLEIDGMIVGTTDEAQ